MNRIKQLFETKQRDICSIYYPAGYPTCNSLRPILSDLQTAGVDLVEIGIPFSDPMADGVVIQQACNDALKNGISLRLIFEQLANFRNEGIQLPVILMGYLNPILQYGFEAFCRSCQQVGIDGVIIPDLPFAEYLASYKNISQQYGINVIMLISPETSDARILEIDQHTDGFLYMVSSAATTGTQSSFDASKIAYFKRVAALPLRNPRLVGFGISNQETYKVATTYAAGAIIGSRFVQLLKTERSSLSAILKLKEELGRV